MAPPPAAAGERWELFPHGAGVGIRGMGPTPEAAFARAACALTAAITDLDLVEARAELTVECEAPSLEALLFEWIATLVFEMSARSMLFGAFEVHIEGRRLRARLLGEPLDRARHGPAAQVKGPTHAELRVGHDPGTGAWLAQCVVDV